MPFRRSEDAINHMLRNLGPNWPKIAPEAARIIKGKWPKAKIEGVMKITKPQGFEIGQRIIHTNGGTYEYTGQEGDKAWKLIKE